MNAKSIVQKILLFPLTKILVGLLVCGGLVTFARYQLTILLDSTSLDTDYQHLIVAITVALLAIISYSLLYKFYERRKITEFSFSGIVKNVGLGIMIGAVLQSLTIVVMMLNGNYSLVSVNPIVFIIPPLSMSISSGIIEETLTRGIIFRITEEKLGSTIALIISALLFGLAHLGNPHSSLTVAIGLAIQAGLLLGSAYMYARNLWFPIAIHFAWNFTQSAIYGASVSGNAISKTLITSKIEGADWITGGQFGPEGSIQATVFCLCATIVLLFLSHKRNNIMKPYWKMKTCDSLPEMNSH